MYIKINGSDEHYNASITTFKTRTGNDAVGIVGEMPITDKGFIIYDDNDKVLNDLSEYIYLYGDSGKAYTKTEENSESGESTFDPIPYNPPYEKIYKRIDAVNKKVNNITPYERTKEVYIGDVECVFDNVYKKGNISAYLVIDGEQKPCEITTYENYVVVTFDEAENIGTVTISIQ